MGRRPGTSMRRECAVWRVFRTDRRRWALRVPGLRAYNVRVRIMLAVTGSAYRMCRMNTKNGGINATREA